jgi:hypothetical protein
LSLQFPGEPQQWSCLKTKNTFVKIHGYGRYVYQSYPGYEKQGSNLTIEVIFRGLLQYLQDKEMKSIRNLYVQLDNYSINKSYCVLAAMSALVLLGICRKVKLSYSLVSHGHEDGDREIGTAGIHLCKCDLQSIDVFKTELPRAFQKNHKSVAKVFQLIGITDYESILGPEITFMKETIDGIQFLLIIIIVIFEAIGISSAHKFRISAVPDRTNVGPSTPLILYTPNIMNGWCPRPAPLVKSSIWKKLFAHPSTPGSGAPISVKAEPVLEKGNRQTWNYLVSYAAGSGMNVDESFLYHSCFLYVEELFRLDCPSIPCPLNRDLVVQKFSSTVRQLPHPDYHKTLTAVHERINILLVARKDQEFKDAWEGFFSELPSSPAVAHDTYINALGTLAIDFGGPLQIHENPYVRAKTDADYIDTITFVDGPVSYQERISLLKDLGLYAPRVRKKRKGVTAEKATDPKPKKGRAKAQRKKSKTVEEEEDEEMIEEEEEEDEGEEEDNDEDEDSDQPPGRQRPANKRKPDAASKVVRQSRTYSKRTTVLDEEEDLEEDKAQTINQPRVKKAVSNSRLKRKVPEVDASSEESEDHNISTPAISRGMSKYSYALCLHFVCVVVVVVQEPHKKRPQPTYVYEVVPTASWVDSSQISDKNLIAGRRGRR